MRRALVVAIAAAAVSITVAAPAAAATKPQPKPARPPVDAIGTLQQLAGPAGCVVDTAGRTPGCAKARALRGAGPFLGSNAVTVSPDGLNVYVAAGTSDAIAIFRRDTQTGRLTQAAGTAGCIAVAGANGCATAAGLDGANSVAVSADGRHVYATARDSGAVTTFTRARSTGALTQATDGSGCIAQTAQPGCTTGRALTGADVVAVSPDGRNVYVGAFFANAVATFQRDAVTGALTQPDGEAGCLAATAADGCATGVALGAPEGLAVSPDGTTVTVADATANSVLPLTRNPATGALTQATDGTGCIVDAALTGCTTGTRIEGANAVAVSPGGASTYVTALRDNSLASFSATTGGGLTQLTGTSACVINLLAVGCSLGRSFAAPEGLAVSPDEATVYVAAFGSSAIAVLDRDATTGGLMQKPRDPGCVTNRPTPGCTHGRGLAGVSSVAVSPDGKFVYAAAFATSGVSVFRRITKEMTHGR